MDEAKLLPRILALDREALAEMYDTYSDSLYGYAFRLLNSQSLAEDCVSETFTNLLAAIESGKGPRVSIKAYLFRATHNWITDIYRRQPPEPLPLNEALLRAGDEPENNVETHLAHKQVLHAMRDLTTDQQQVVMLKFVEGWTNKQVAEAMQKPIGAVKSLQHRALESLRRLLDQNE